MARPKKSPSDLRTVHVAFCVSPSEQARLEELAEKAQLTKAEFARTAALGKSIKVVESSSPDFLDRNELRRIGVNLNQLARAVNEGRLPSPARLDGVIAKLDSLFDQWLEYGSPRSPSR